MFKTKEDIMNLKVLENENEEFSADINIEISEEEAEYLLNTAQVASEKIDEIEKKGIASSKDEDKDDEIENLRKELNELRHLFQKVYIKFNSFENIMKVREKEWEKIKETTFDTDVLINNIKKGLPNVDISEQDINEIVRRAIKKIENQKTNNITVKKKSFFEKNRKNILYGSLFFFLLFMFFVIKNLDLEQGVKKKINSQKLNGSFTLKSKSNVICSNNTKYYLSKDIKVKGYIEGDKIYFNINKEVVCNTEVKNIKN